MHKFRGLPVGRLSWLGHSCPFQHRHWWTCPVLCLLCKHPRLQYLEFRQAAVQQPGVWMLPEECISQSAENFIQYLVWHYSSHQWVRLLIPSDPCCISNLPKIYAQIMEISLPDSRLLVQADNCLFSLGEFQFQCIDKVHCISGSSSWNFHATGPLDASSSWYTTLYLLMFSRDCFAWFP